VIIIVAFVTGPTWCASQPSKSTEDSSKAECQLFTGSVCYNCDFSQALSDDVALHKVDVDDICGMAHTLAAVSSTSIGMVKAEASQLTGRFQALVSSVQVTSANATFAALYYLSCH